MSQPFFYAAVFVHWRRLCCLAKTCLAYYCKKMTLPQAFFVFFLRDMIKELKGNGMTKDSSLRVVDDIVRHFWSLIWWLGCSLLRLFRRGGLLGTEKNDNGGEPLPSRGVRLILFCGLAMLAITILSLIEGNSWHVYQHGEASWYGPGFYSRRTASGEIFRSEAPGYTAAHMSLPIGSHVLVRNRRNGREVIVRINDRGPYARGRIIDLNRAAAERLDIVSGGMAPVTIFLRRY